jgi:hypothetical protein
MFEAFRGMFASANAPDPHDVAVAIAKLIATPKGARPARAVIGQAFGADAVNEAVAPIQQQVIETLDLGALATKSVKQLAGSAGRVAKLNACRGGGCDGGKAVEQHCIHTERQVYAGAPRLT